MNKTLLLLGLGLAACGDLQTYNPYTSYGSESDVSGSETESGSGSSSETESGSGTGSEGWPESDGGIPDLPLGDAFTPCSVFDFLFVIDNSGSMQDDQKKLVDSFEDFMAGVQSITEGAGDYHVMVVDSDDKHHVCEWSCGLDSSVCDTLTDGLISCDNLSVCDSTLGAGMTFPVGMGASNMDCGLDPDQRFLTEEKLDKFPCIAQVGIEGNYLESMLSASWDAVKVNACNTGFLRPEAVLVILYITDEDMINSEAVKMSPFLDDFIGDLKLKPSLDGIVFLGLTPNEGHWNGFFDYWTTEMGGYGLRWNITSDFGVFFQQAIEPIEESCLTFQPQG